MDLTLAFSQIMVSQLKCSYIESNSIVNGSMFNARALFHFF